MALRSLEDILEKFMRGLAWQLDVPKSVGGCVIDADYKGPVAVIFFNFFEKSVDIGKGDRFCQIFFHKIANHPVLREVDNCEDKTDRGEASSGSTNTKMSAGKIFANNYIPEYVTEDLHLGMKGKVWWPILIN